MKSTFALVVGLSAMVFTASAADVTVKLSDVHLCCKSCVTGADKAVATVPGAKDTVDMDEGTVTLTAADNATLQKAVNALTTAGYFGKSSNPAIKVDATTGAKGSKVQTLDVSGVHLCCTKCVKAVGTAVGSVPGVSGNNAEKGAKTFTVTGDFDDKELFAALQKAGLTGKVGK